MQVKKEILLFYTILIVSTAIVIAADRVPTREIKVPVKCCKKAKPAKATSPWNFITEGVLRFSV